MSVIIKRVWNQNKLVNIESLHGMTFQAEDGGHVFQISGIDDTGAAVALTGTVAGVFRRPDNADIALTGSASGGVASVTLTNDCYAVPGRFGLTIFVTSGGQKTAVYACIGTVAGTSGGAVAGETPQDVVDLINAIEAAVATIPADYTDLMAAIAPTYSNAALYAAGAYAWYDGKLYRCTTAITTAETWTAAHWVSVALGNDVTDLKRESQLADALSTGNLNVEWEQGGLYSATGLEYDSSTNIRSNYINVTPGENICIAGLDFTNFVYIIHKFSSVGTQEGNAASITAPYVTMTTPLVRFRITKNPYTDTIVPNDANVIFYRNDGYLNQSSFTIRNNLKSGDNIDTLFITGNYNIYASDFNDVGGTFPSQLPSPKPCSIIVISAGVLDRRGTIQIISTASQITTGIFEKPFVFLRRHNGESWENWISLTQQMGLVRSNTDINTIVDAGQYSFIAGVVETLTGLPDDFGRDAGVLVVCSGDGSIGRTVQILYNSISKSWTRYHNDDYDAQDSSVGWTAWKKTNYNSYMLSNGTDINRLYEPGQYSFYGITEIFGKPANFGGVPGVLQVVGGSGTYARIAQTIQNMYNETWTRYHNDDYDPEDSSVGWTEWKQQVNSFSIRSNEDINTYINSGEYSFTGVIARTLTGLPLSWSGPGILNVITGTKTVGRTIQVLYSYNNETYIRYHNDDYDPEDSSVGWTEWKSMDQTGFDARRYIKRKPNASLKQIGIPAVFVYGDMTGISHDTAVNITWKYVTNAESGTGTVSSDTYTGTLKWQGRGSLNFPKKNYTLKSDTKYDFGWGKQKKYVLKGNWLDPAMANNLLGAKLWGQIAADHVETYPAQLVASPNYGAVDGFPVMLYLNDEYSGVYNLNIPKDKWMANMTLAEGTTECIVCSDASTDTCGWAAPAETLEDLQTGWCLEELSDGIDDGVALRALNQAIGAVMTAYNNQDRNWEQTVGQYIDIDSAIDFYILRCLIDDRDAMRNNQLLMTYNLADPLENPETPTKWYFIPYDMDMTFGATNRYYSNVIINKIGDNRFKVYAQANQNLLFYLIYNYSRDRLMARYTALRDYHMAYRNVYYIYANITGQIPAKLIEQEHVLYPLTPADNVMSLTQAMLHYRINCEVCDADLYDET